MKILKSKKVGKTVYRLVEELIIRPNKTIPVYSIQDNLASDGEFMMTSFLSYFDLSDAEKRFQQLTHPMRTGRQPVETR